MNEQEAQELRSEIHQFHLQPVARLPCALAPAGLKERIGVPGTRGWTHAETTHTLGVTPQR